jgi:glucose-6-phosphate 1-dehydrogenase
MTASLSDALVLFGVTGDLAHKMIFPALYAMVKHGTLKVPVIGVALPKWSPERLHKRVTDSIERSGLGARRTTSLFRPRYSRR